MDEQAEMMARMAAMRNRAGVEDRPPSREPKNAKPERSEAALARQQPQSSGRGSQKSMANNNVDHKVYWGMLWNATKLKLGGLVLWAIIVSAVWTAITKQPMQMKQAADGFNPIFWGSNLLGAPAGNTVTTINNQVVAPLNAQIDNGEITIVPAPGAKNQDIPDIQQQQAR